MMAIVEVDQCVVDNQKGALVLLGKSRESSALGS